MKIDDNIRTRILNIVGRTGNVTRAAELSGVSRTAIYNLVKRDPEFAAEYQRVLEAYKTNEFWDVWVDEVDSLL
jgi:predicted DNA-binding protein YlxM (UPF0122 family)